MIAQAVSRSAWIKWLVDDCRRSYYPFMLGIIIIHNGNSHALGFSGQSFNMVDTGSCQMGDSPTKSMKLPSEWGPDDKYLQLLGVQHGTTTAHYVEFHIGFKLKWGPTPVSPGAAAITGTAAGAAMVATGTATPVPPAAT